MSDQQQPQRKNPSPGVLVSLGGPNVVFLTVTTHHRVPWLASAEVHRLIHETWHDAMAWLVGDYLLMPDHLHLFCAPRDPKFEIEQWIAYWKSEFRRHHGNPDWRFQSRGWHHRLRHDEDYSAKWHYVQENPVRAGLVNRAEDWPYKGRVHEIRW
ncbi:MAG: hypothetical protein HZA91_06310 [Verrucomicrobia bacterium]|nr:hypothetical protein [Verrucomicrobiota bacterium]